MLLRMAKNLILKTQNSHKLVTARKALNALAHKGLLYSEKTVKRNKRYLNYDLQRILDA